MVVTVVGTIFVFSRNRNLTAQDTQQEMLSRQRNLNYRLQIKGFKLDSFDSGEDVLSIKAEKFTIEKKKLGFFRLGLINVAIFKNAIIDIYLKRKNPGNDIDNLIEGLPALKDALPSFSAKRISSIIIEPVCLNLWDEKTLLTQITSKSAIIRLIKQDIHFKGAVQVVSGNKRLITENLEFSSENSVLKTDRHFILRTSKETINGNHIILDMFLNRVKKEVISKSDDPNRLVSTNWKRDLDLFNILTV